jgi:hypothetical protein
MFLTTWATAPFRLARRSRPSLPSPARPRLAAPPRCLRAAEPSPERAQATRNISAAIETSAIVLSRGATMMKAGVATETIVQYRVAATVHSSSSIDATLGRNCLRAAEATGDR